MPAFPFFPFTLPVNSIHPPDQKLYRPILMASITAPTGQTVRWGVVADSGADECMLPLSLAHKLGLDLDSLPTGITGSVGNQTNLTYYQDLTIDLGKGIQFAALVGFTQGMNDIGFGLFGQIGFFDRFHVDFRQSEGIFTIEPTIKPA